MNFMNISSKITRYKGKNMQVFAESGHWIELIFLIKCMNSTMKP